MLRFIRKNANSLIMVIIFIIIIFIFAFNFFPYNNKNQNKAEFIVKINNNVITINEFKFAYNEYLQKIKKITSIYHEKQSSESALKRTVIEELIEEELFSELALNNNISISDNELFKNININYFNEKLDFNSENYLKIMSHHKINQNIFENYLKKKLLTKKVKKLLYISLNLSDNKIWRNFKNVNSKISLIFIKINPFFFRNKKKFSINDINKFIMQKKIKFIKLNKILNNKQKIMIMNLMKKENSRIKAKEYSRLLLQKLKSKIKIYKFKLLTIKNNKFNIIFDNSSFFMKNSYFYIQKIGKNNKVIKKLFSLNLKNKLFKKIINIDDSFFIMTLKNAKYPSKVKFFMKKAELKSKFNDKNKKIKNFLFYLKNKSKIKYNKMEIN